MSVKVSGDRRYQLGDIVFTTDNEYFVNNCYGGLPVLGEHASPKKNEIKIKQLYKYDGKAFNTKIGFITNCSTTLYEMLTQYEPGSKEYEEIINRLKLCCHMQALTIDAAKGIKTQPFPKYWTKWTKITEEMSEEEKQQSEFNNSLLIEKRPKFMRHLYPAYNSQYKEYVKNQLEWILVKHKLNIDSIEDLNPNDEEHKKILDRYYKRDPLIETNGVMNKVCDIMEKSYSATKTRIKLNSDDKIFELYFSKNFKVDKDKLEMMSDLFRKYNDFKRTPDILEEYGNVQKYTKYLREQADWISFDDDELCDLAVYVCYVLNKSKSKDFCWDMYGNIILRHISENQNNTIIEIPMKDCEGNIKYLEKKYDLKGVDISDYI